MTDDTGTCTLCDLPTPDPPHEAADVSGTFCCRGCLEVARTLDGDAAAADAETARAALDEAGTGASADADPAGSTPDDAEAAFLAVDGMHCATCETFLESRARDREGVHDATASYAADTMKVVYDPDRLTEPDLPDLVAGYGYDARPAEAGGGGTREESVGRLLVGGFLGMMTMLWYVLFLYPTYLGLPAEALLLDVTGPAGRYLLANVWLFATVVLGYTGFPILRGAYVSLRAGEPNMDLLVALAATTAYVYSTAALLVGRAEVYFDITVVVVVVVTLGGYYERRVKDRATGELADVTDARTETAHRRTGDGIEDVPAASLTGGDEVVVRPGEAVPVDGRVVEGTATVDESLVTGEAVPVGKAPGDEAVGGSTVTDGRLVVAVEEGAPSTRDRLVRALWDVRSGRGGTQRLADRLAGAFVPLVLLLAAGAFVAHLALGATPTGALLTGLAVLVVSCPCALGLATPLAVASGVREALDRGVVVTDDSLFERGAAVGTVAFDKTGTLTTGEMRLLDAVGDPRALRLAAAVEQFSEHPVAEAVVDAADAADATVESFERHARGVSATVDGDHVVVGRADLLAARGLDVPADLRDRYEAAEAEGAVPSLVGWDGRARGLLVVGDEPRPGWRDAVAAVADRAEVVVLTGDGEAAAARFRDCPDVSETFADVPPEAKAAVVERLRTDREGPVAMVGDGTNDAPALGAADVGVAMASGTRVAADAADAVVLGGGVERVPTAFDLATAARTRIRRNLGWALLYNAVAVPAAALGLISPLVAAVAMAGSSLLVVGNSARSLPVEATDAGSPPAPDEDGTTTATGGGKANATEPRRTGDDPAGAGE
ncbi:MAG: heavy metal translocating P-type ATPase [Haloferacaceae archaeon]